MAAASDSSHQSGRALPPVRAATAACAPPTAAMEDMSSWAESEARAAGRSIWPVGGEMERGGGWRREHLAWGGSERGGGARAPAPRRPSRALLLRSRPPLHLSSGSPQIGSRPASRADERADEGRRGTARRGAERRQVLGQKKKMNSSLGRSLTSEQSLLHYFARPATGPAASAGVLRHLPGGLLARRAAATWQSTRPDKNGEGASAAAASPPLSLSLLPPPRRTRRHTSQ